MNSRLQKKDFETAGEDVLHVPAFRDDGHIRSLREIEIDVIRVALILAGGRRALAARQLGISRSTLARKLRN